MTWRSTSTGRSGWCGWYLAGDLGRAAYHLLTRGRRRRRSSGYLLFDIRAARRRRSRRSGSCVSLVLAVVTSFAIRWLVAVLGLLAARPERPADARRRAGALLQRDGAAAGDLPRAVAVDRAGAAVGVVPPDARRHLARPARGPRDCSPALARAGGVDRRAARLGQVVLVARPPARWWCRVADLERRAGGSSAVRLDRADVGPRLAGLPDVVLDAHRGGRDHHRPRLRRHLRSCSATIDTLGGFGLREIALLYGATGVGARRGRPGHRQRRADRPARPHRQPRRDDDAAGAAAGAGLRRPVRAAPARADQPGGGGVRLGARCRRLDAGPGRRRRR